MPARTKTLPDKSYAKWLAREDRAIEKIFQRIRMPRLEDIIKNDAHAASVHRNLSNLRDSRDRCVAITKRLDEVLPPLEAKWDAIQRKAAGYSAPSVELEDED